MKKTIAVIGSAAALSFAGIGLAAAEDTTPAPTEGNQVETTADETEDGENDAPETPAEVSEVAQQLCGTISAYDFLGSAGSLLPGLSGEECEANADAAIAAATSGDIQGALDFLRGIDAEVPGDDEPGDETEAGDTGSAGFLDAFDGLSSAPAGDEADAAAPAA